MLLGSEGKDCVLKNTKLKNNTQAPKNFFPECTCVLCNNCACFVVFQPKNFHVFTSLCHFKQRTFPIERRNTL